MKTKRPKKTAAERSAAEQATTKKEREMADMEMHCVEGHSFLCSETGRGPNRYCSVCGKEAHLGVMAGCVRCKSLRMINNPIFRHVAPSVPSAPVSEVIASVTVDTIIAIANEFERMPDNELVAFAEECLRRIGSPRDASGNSASMDLNSPAAAMHHIVLPQLITRFKRRFTG